MPVHRWLPAAMVAPTPVSALLHAVAVVKAGVFSVVKVLVYVFGVDVLAATAGADWLVGVAGFTIIAASVVALDVRQSQAPARLFHGEPALVRRAGGCAADAAVDHRRGDAHRSTRARQDHAVLRRRRDLYRRSQDRGEPARRHRPAHAVDDGRVRRRRTVDDRAAAGGRLRQQVVHALRRDGGCAVGGGRGDRRQHAAERRLFPADRLPCLLSRAGRAGARASAWRGAARRW